MEIEEKDRINCLGLGIAAQMFLLGFCSLVCFSFICSYNQSNDFVGDELSLHPLKLENVSESPSAESLPLSPVSETFWLSPTREEEKEFATQNRIKGKKTCLLEFYYQCDYFIQGIEFCLSTGRVTY